MKLKIILLAILLSPICRLFGQESGSILLSSDENITVEVYKPIDGHFNQFVMSDKLELKPNISITYDVNCSDFSFVRLQFPGGKYIVPIIKGDQIKLKYSNKTVSFSGNNSEGHIYYNRNIVQEFGMWSMQVDSIFDANIEQGVNFQEIDKGLQVMYNRVKKDLDSLEAKGVITSDFAEIIDTEVYYGIQKQVINDLKILSFGKMIKLSAEDSVAVNEKLGSLFAVYPEAKKLHQHNLGNSYTNDYYRYMYSQLTPEAKDNLVKDYGKETFGPYVYNLLAPDYIQSAKLGSALIFQLMYMVNEFDKDKMLQYLTDRYPQSEYLVIINEELKKQKAKSNSSNASIVISEKSVNSLQELTSVESLKGKYIYIDVWATWCLPCKMEFQYNADLHELLSQYDNIAPVYISIDKPEFRNAWEKELNNYELQGYNILASDSLTKEIGLIDEARGLAIPKYILLDPTGKIVDGNLPRPSSLPKLKEALDKYLK